MNILLIIISYLLGSILFSQVIARVFLRVDLSNIGDGNPGSTNVLKSGHKGWAMLAFLLDGLKGLVPVYFFAPFVDQNFYLALLIAAPIIGHAFSIFHRFKGGKALAVSLGVWIGATNIIDGLVLVIVVGIFKKIFKRITFGIKVIIALLLFNIALYFNDLSWPYYLALFINIVIVYLKHPIKRLDDIKA